MRSTQQNRKILTLTDKPQLNMPENTWKFIPVSETKNNVLIKCDLCKYWHIIGENHTIDPDGTVHPSVVSENLTRCGFHEFIKLENYSVEG